MADVQTLGMVLNDLGLTTSWSGDVLRLETANATPNRADIAWSAA